MTQLVHQPIHTYYEAFQRPFVRDLAYVLACPNVTTRWLGVSPLPAPPIGLQSPDFWLTQYHRYLPRLLELNTSTAYQQLTKFLFARPSPHRLGFHFEGLLAFWLVDGYRLGVHAFELIAHNVPLYRERQTIGELDFIVLNHTTNCVEHWELAIKFFLGSPPFTPTHWQGINSKDTLQRKMRHMQDKQFGVVWVETNTHGRVKIDKRFAIIKGRFFLPLPIDNIRLHRHLPLATQISQHRLHRSGFAAQLPDWLSPTLPCHHWTTLSALTDTSTASTLPTLGLHQARYVEWITERTFYHNAGNAKSVCQNPKTSKLSKLSKPRYRPFRTGLYLYANPADKQTSVTQRLVVLNDTYK